MQYTQFPWIHGKHLSMCLNLTEVTQAGLKQMLKYFAGSSLALITSTITRLLHLERKLVPENPLEQTPLYIYYFLTHRICKCKDWPPLKNSAQPLPE